MDRFTVPPVLVPLIALMTGLQLTTGFHIVAKVTDRHCGIVAIAPWRERLSAAIAAVGTAWRIALLAFLRPHQGLIGATLMVALCLAHPDSADALAGLALVGVAGQINILQLESDLRAKKTAAKELIESQMRACQAYVVTAATATAPAVTGRERTPEEKAAVQAILEDAKAIRGRIDGAQGDANMLAEIERLTEGMLEQGRTPTGQSAPVRSGGSQTPGQQFFNDPAVRAFLDQGGHRVQQGVQFTSPGVEVPRQTLLDTSGGSGGPLVVPDYQAGVLPLLFRSPVVADLIAPGTTNSNLITYFKELAVTNAAAAVAQGVAKPESAISFEAASDAVVKIATWIPATTEAMDDIPALSSMIDGRLRMFLGLAEDDQLLNGTGIAPNMRGIMNRLALAAAIARGADSTVDAIFRQISAIATNAFIQPDGWVMNPANWLTVQLSKNAAGNYLGTGPWATAQVPMLWGVPGAITPAQVANTALVGAFRTCAQFFRKGGVRLAMSNSHLGYFVENKVAILIEERGALAVYREAAFGKVTGLN